MKPATLFVAVLSVVAVGVVYQYSQEPHQRPVLRDALKDEFQDINLSSIKEKTRGTRLVEGHGVDPRVKDSGDKPRSSRPYQSFDFESWKCDFLNLNVDVSRIVMGPTTVDYLVLLAKFPQDNSNYKLAELAQKMRFVICPDPEGADDANRGLVRPVVHEQYMVLSSGGSCGLMIETTSARQSLKQLIKETLGAEGEVMLLPSTMFGYNTNRTPAPCVPQFPN